MNEYPEDLVDNPIPVVGLMGMNTLHSSILGYMSSKLNESGESKPLLRFLSLDFSVSFPKTKKRVNYDGYQPAGILKANWLNNHKCMLPSCVATFFNFEEKVWRGKENETYSQLDTLR